MGIFKKLFSFVFFLSVSFLFVACSSSKEMGRENKSFSRSYNDGIDNISAAPIATPSGEANQNSPKVHKRMMVYSVNVNLQSKEIEAKVTEVIKLAESYGGYALQYSSNGSVQLKIPADKLKQFLSTLRNQSQNYSEEVSAQDVTEDYTDTEIRMENSLKMRVRLLEILKSAKTLEETLKVEAELNKVSESIERWEGKLKYLSSSVQLSSVHVQVRQKWEPVVQKEYKPGPLGLPFYYLYLGLGKVKDGIIWMFVQEIPKEKTELPE
ncbi:DUF4349 domain-containing protein [Leptospira bourretii]|uniref:DUF4349 domain-containing protein n=1 Tax=Leptospira bourretii TaxID=2484962 RepID=A0A4R9IM02_9LEPT|nr:DUF4349 domain-containing protein [Leptospira bourretii]TGK85226.1 DUF4349 domain-containing protein [Leptospira bourretii]TGK90988.1 DUF4349 domain-containing protein [Leptospira bourretii]TGL23268.1 DUF4349 domain-containing protein [Leptospira bourretii]TGL35642.1 DUF4349 domain-containing protein [Leptospira bourretii]